MNEYQQALLRIIELEDKNAELLEELEEGLDTVCHLCRVHNPQHAECTGCVDTDSWRKAIRKHKGE